MGRADDEKDTNWSCRRDGCGRCETNLAQGDNDGSAVNKYLALAVTLDEAKSGEVAKAESGTSLAQTLSKTYSSAMDKIKSIIMTGTATGNGDLSQSVHLSFYVRR